MAEISQAVLQQVGLKTSPFGPTSRYNAVGLNTLETADGKSTVHLRRRIIPRNENFYVLQQHTVAEGERLDLITAHYLGDPERFWLLCDANSTMNPSELTEYPGSKIKITLPAGIPGNTNA